MHVAPHLHVVVHAIKASRVTSNIPCTSKGVKYKVKLVQNYIYNLENNNIPINGFRFELCFKGNLSLGDVEQPYRNYNVTNGIPEGIEIAIRVSNNDYLEMIQFAYIEHKKLGKGGSSKQPSVQTKSHLVKLLNYVGLFSTRFEKLLNIKSRVEIEPPPPSDQEPCKRNCSVTLLFIKMP